MWQHRLQRHALPLSMLLLTSVAEPEAHHNPHDGYMGGLSASLNVHIYKLVAGIRLQSHPATLLAAMGRGLGYSRNSHSSALKSWLPPCNLFHS